MAALLLFIRNILIRLLELVVIILVAVLVLDVLWGVISRYVFGSQSRWTEELAIMLLIWVSLLGASVALGSKSHLGVDYFVRKLHPDAQLLMEVIVNLIVAAFAAAALVWGGYILVVKTVASGQLSPALGIKVGYTYMAAPVSGIFMVIFCVENIVEILSGRKKSPDLSEQET